MSKFVKWVDGLPTIAKFLLDLLYGVLGNLYRLARSIAKKDVLGIVLAALLIFTGGFGVLWIIDLVFIALGKPLLWID